MRPLTFLGTFVASHPGNPAGGGLMSFVVSCTCGKQYKVADENRGKTSKCKGCGTMLRLEPDADAAYAAAPPPPPPPAVAGYGEDGGGGDDPFANIDWDAAA